MWKNYLSVLFAEKFPTINRFLSNKWYLDDINEKLFVKGSRKLAKEVLEVDSKVVDGVVNLTGLVTLGSGEGLKYFETGRAQFYALIVFGGVILLVAIFGFQSPQVSWFQLCVFTVHWGEKIQKISRLYLR